MNNRSPRVLKWGWALGLSASVGMLLMSERSSPWFPVLHMLIDSIQQQLTPTNQQRNDPGSPISSEPAATGNRSDTNPSGAPQPPIAEESFSSCSAWSDRYSPGCGPR